MAEVRKVEAVTVEVEKYVVVEEETRPAGFELFLTEEEARGLRTFLGLGTTSRTLQHLGLENVWEELAANVNVKWVNFDQVAKLDL